MEQSEEFYLPERYKDLLPELGICSEEIVNQISYYHLEFPKTRDNLIERKTQLPPFINAFYGYIYFTGDIPTQEDYFEYYLATAHDELLENYASKPYYLHAIKARMYRAYPSFVRDIHFNKLVKESFSSCDVKYNLILDHEKGVDLMVSKGAQHCGVNLYTDTNRGMFYRRKKTHRHIYFQNVIPIEFPVTLSQEHLCGEFYLYGEKELDILRQKLCAIFGVSYLV